MCTNFDACVASPCFPGVVCTDQPPPSTGRTCGACPTEYAGNGANCVLTPLGGACGAITRIHSADPVFHAAMAWSSDAFGFVAGVAGSADVTFGAGAGALSLSNGAGKLWLARMDNGGGAAWGRLEPHYGTNGALLAVDATGNPAVVSTFGATATLGLGLANDPPGGVTLAGPGNSSLSVAKYDAADGHLLWARSMGMAGYNDVGREASDVVVTSDGRVAVVGRGSGDLYYNGNVVVDATAEGLTSAYGYLLATNGNGGMGWVATISGPNPVDSPVAMAVGGFPNGAVLAAGTGSAVFGSGTPDELVNTRNWWFTRYTAGGAPRWTFGIHSAQGNLQWGDVAVGPAGDIFVTGAAWSWVSFYNADGTLGEAKQMGSGTGTAAGFFIAKYASSGTLEWVRQVATSTGAGQYGLRVTGAADGGAVLAGYHYGTITIGAGSPREAVLAPVMPAESGFTARYRADGTLGWARADSGLVTPGAPVGVAVLSNDAVLVTGVYGGQGFTCDPGIASERSVAAQGSNDDAYMVVRLP